MDRRSPQGRPGLRSQSPGTLQLSLNRARCVTIHEQPRSPISGRMDAKDVTRRLASFAG
jgi:hypothetical protein